MTDADRGRRLDVPGSRDGVQATLWDQVWLLSTAPPGDDPDRLVLDSNIANEVVRAVARGQPVRTGYRAVLRAAKRDRVHLALGVSAGESAFEHRVRLVDEHRVAEWLAVEQWLNEAAFQEYWEALVLPGSPIPVHVDPRIHARAVLIAADHEVNLAESAVAIGLLLQAHRTKSQWKGDTFARRVRRMSEWRAETQAMTGWLPDLITPLAWSTFFDGHLPSLKGSARTLNADTVLKFSGLKPGGVRRGLLNAAGDLTFVGVMRWPVPIACATGDHGLAAVMASIHRFFYGGSTAPAAVTWDLTDLPSAWLRRAEQEGVNPYDVLIAALHERPIMPLQTRPSPARILQRLDDLIRRIESSLAGLGAPSEG